MLWHRQRGASYLQLLRLVLCKQRLGSSVKRHKPFAAVATLVHDRVENLDGMHLSASKGDLHHGLNDVRRVEDPVALVAIRLVVGVQDQNAIV